ncbi:MAG: PEGA domain-containing protein [Myxococcota bacterium]
MLAAVLAVSTVAHAQPQGEDPRVAAARAAFIEGNELASDARWGDALARFEHSASLRPHPGTTYNIGVCQRALGQYTRARKTFAAALAENEATADHPLAKSTIADIRAFLREIDEDVLGSLEVTLRPATAALAVDGRPIEFVGQEGGVPVGWAGTLPPGRGKPPPAPIFRLMLDPGTHVFVVSRKGFADAVVRETVVPGTRDKLDLALERLPGKLHIESNEPNAVVAVNDLDVGMTPVTLPRPSGRYHVVVRKKGFVTYETHAQLDAGERVNLRAVLRREEAGLTEKWWFWSAVGVVVIGSAVGTYYATRPEPERPPVDGGGLGWTVRVP